MAALVVKHPGCGGNAIRAKNEARTLVCLRCGVRFTVPSSEETSAPALAELVGGASSTIDPESIDCGYEPRGFADSWTQVYRRIVRATDGAVLFGLDDGREVWVPKSVLIAVGSRAFECAMWFARKEIDV